MTNIPFDMRRKRKREGFARGVRRTTVVGGRCVGESCSASSLSDLDRKRDRGGLCGSLHRPTDSTEHDQNDPELGFRLRKGAVGDGGFNVDEMIQLKSAWDAVVTCFFIDTAHNIVEYIEIISRILKNGGVWINLGPLLYHFAEMYGQEDEMSIELSLEDVKRVALHYGFEFEKESTIETTYTTNPRSMMQNRYFAAFWIMRKKSASARQLVP
ncbi:carnosine N-methyltransferase-like isoform X3 [Senna tora]|uniref:carnosine N-methyltransferase n=1 Tax=Senna tora TaxID=362788 RepID=A0A834WAE9_9FABA|nr:carnosine N-methyltransferase-like isoform X3 [Senna tora]